MKFGGQPGQYPPVAICGLFSDEYDAKSLFDPIKGTFNKEEAEKRIAMMQEWSDITKIPATLDALGHTVDAVDKLVNFFADHLEGPFLLDAPSTEIRLPAYELAVEAGLRDRIVYNSLSPEITMSDIQKLKELKVKHILVLAINDKNIWPEGRIELLEGTAEEPGLMQLTKDTGAENIIIDTATLGTAGLAIANAAIPLIKEKYGLPTGSGTANAPHVWPLDKEYHDTVFG
ncbi:MAG: hypothetical protein JSV32_03395, partial [Dehalococcoidia bacterium]